jgi:hypothetical protein
VPLNLARGRLAKLKYASRHRVVCLVANMVREYVGDNFVNLPAQRMAEDG